MPKQVYVRGVGYVRAGSWSTKSFYERWKQTMKQLEDSFELMPLRIRHLMLSDLSDLPEHERELAKTLREDGERIIWQLEVLRDHCDALIREIPKDRQITERIQALENIAGRTPEEAAIYLEKASKLRAEL